MFIELPPYSASPADPPGTPEALFDLHTLTMDSGARAEQACRLRLLGRPSRPAHDRLAVAAEPFVLTYTCVR